VSCCRYFVFFCITQTGLKPALNPTRLEAYLGLKIDSTEKFSQTSFFAITTPKKKTLKSHSMHLFVKNIVQIPFFAKTAKKLQTPLGSISKATRRLWAAVCPPLLNALWVLGSRFLVLVVLVSYAWAVMTTRRCRHDITYQDIHTM
jgi:hypothetical protein